MATVIPLRDFNDNEIVLAAFGDWLNDRSHAIFRERTEARTNACVAGVRRFGYFIEPVPLCQSTVAELRSFKTELRGCDRHFPIRQGMPDASARVRVIRRLRSISKKVLSEEDKSALLGIRMFQGFCREVLKKGWR
jgi:hypothetical protein